jgi:hypothetical protein
MNYDRHSRLLRKTFFFNADLNHPKNSRQTVPHHRQKIQKPTAEKHTKRVDLYLYSSVAAAPSAKSIIWGLRAVGVCQTHTVYSGNEIKDSQPPSRTRTDDDDVCFGIN